MSTCSAEHFLRIFRRDAERTYVPKDDADVQERWKQFTLVSGGEDLKTTLVSSGDVKIYTYIF